MAQGQLVATHARDWDKAQTFYEPGHYLALLERKPGAFDVARPLEDWELPGCFWLLRRRLEADLGSNGHPRVHQGAAPHGALHARAS